MNLTGNKYMKFEVDTLRNKEIQIKNNIFKETSKVKRGDNSENIGARDIHIVTYDVSNNEYIIAKIAV